jgi:hypothetical protein
MADRDADYLDNIINSSATKKYSEMDNDSGCWGNHCKGDDSTEGGIKKIVSRNDYQSFTNVGKSVSLLKGTTLKEMLCK